MTAEGSRPWRRVASPATAIAVFGLALTELATAIACALAGGISFASAVGSFTVTNGAIGLTLSACGALLAWHRPRNSVGWLFLTGGVAYATSTAAIQLAGLGATVGWNAGVLRLLASLSTLGWPLAIGLCLPMALLLFPDGRPPGPRWRWLIWAIAAEALLFELMFAGPASQTFGSHSVTPYLALPSYDRLGAVWAATNIALAAILALILASLVVRYRRGGDVERRQLLWLVLACLAVFGYGGLWWGITGTGPVLGLLVIPLIPAAVTIAILRYQLLDIRLVFSRTLAYAIVTGLLVGLYAGLVLLATRVLSFHTPVAVAACTLAAAALFNPLRLRVQRGVDRRFNRARYDADQTVAAFAARLKDAVDLDSVRDDLTSTVYLALEPAHVSVWISQHD